MLTELLQNRRFELMPRLDEEAKGVDKEIYQVGSDIFSQSRAKSGETIYLRMELITEKNKPYIDQYIEQVRHYSVAGGNHRPGLLSYITRFIEPVGQDSYAFTAEAFPQLTWYEKNQGKSRPIDFIREASGYSEEELLAFVNRMGKNGFHSKNKDRTDLHGTIDGAACLCTSIVSFFVYASKDPHFSIQNTQLSNEEVTLKKFISQYANMLACVGSTYSDECCTSRGIFRNPVTAIENTYKGVAIVLLGFSGAVAHRFLNRKTAFIRPVGRMPSVLCAALKENEFTVADFSDTAARKEAESKNAFFEYHPFTIQLKALDRVFKESQRSDDEIAQDRVIAEKHKSSGRNICYAFFKAAVCSSIVATSAYVYCNSTRRFH